MSARTLAEPFPTVTTDTDAMDAARAMAAGRLPGLIVCTDDGRPYTVLPDSQVLRFLIPAYLQDEPGLARALDEQASDEMCRKLERSTVGDLLPDRTDLDALPVCGGDANAMAVAGVRARCRYLPALVYGSRIFDFGFIQSAIHNPKSAIEQSSLTYWK